MSKSPEESRMPSAILELFHRIGYLHETEIERASSTTPRSRTRWKSPRGVMFGNEKWYPIDEVKRHLDARAADVEDERPVVL